jgi:transcription initiation factor TFIIB
MAMSCNELIVDQERGEVVCAETGEIVDEDRVSLGPDWRAYTSDEWNRRAHANVITHTVHDSGLSTEIDLSVRRYREIVKNRKLALLQKRIRVGREERKIVEALTHLNHMCSYLNIPDQVRETAAIILRKVFASLQPKMNKLQILAAASIVLAARKHEIPIRIRELITKFNIDEEEYWKLVSEIHFKTDLNEFKAYVDPRKFLPQIISNLGLSQQVYMFAAKLIDVLKRSGLTEGKDPAGIAAASVYIASIVLDEKKTQKQVAQAANVTEVTIRNRYRDILDKVTITVYI